MPLRTAAGRGRNPAVVAALAALVAVIGLIGPFARPAAAHATLLETTPANDVLLDNPPGEVSLRFDEPVDVADDAIEVLDRDGLTVNDGAVTSDEGGAIVTVPIDATSRGTYTVAWRVLSEDSHNLNGSFIFHVGERTGAVAVDDREDSVVDAVAGVARWLALAATIVVIGASALAALAAVDAGMAARLRRLVLVAASAGVVAVAVLLVAQTAESTGRSLTSSIGDTLDRTLDTRTGVLMVWRLTLLGVAGLAAALGGLWRRAPFAPALVGLGAVGVTSAAGHAWTADERVLAMSSDVVHLSAVSFWIGGLVALAIGSGLAASPNVVVRRFSTAAFICAIVVGATGTLSAILQVRSWDALTGTGYGQLILLKAAGFAALIGLGWWNRARLLPRLDQALAALGRSVRAEVGVAALLLAVTAVLIEQPPARASYDANTGPYDETVQADELTAQLNVTPGRVGTNDLHLYFYEPDGVEAAVVDAVEMTGAVGDIPPRRLEITPITPTHVSALGATLTAPGTWTIEVTAVHEGSPTTVTFEVPIR